MDYPIIWLVVFVFLVLFEIASLGLTTIWFAIGALVAFVAAVLDANIYVQMILFVVVSAVLLVTTRPLFLQLVNKKTVKTNSASLIGEIAVVTIPIDNVMGTGAATINGVEWTARSADANVKFDKDEKVRIKDINGVKLIVEIND